MEAIAIPPFLESGGRSLQVLGLSRVVDCLRSSFIGIQRARVVGPCLFLRAGQLDVEVELANLVPERYEIVVDRALEGNGLSSPSTAVRKPDGPEQDGAASDQQHGLGSVQAPAFAVGVSRADPANEVDEGRRQAVRVVRSEGLGSHARNLALLESWIATTGSKLATDDNCVRLVLAHRPRHRPQHVVGVAADLLPGRAREHGDIDEPIAARDLTAYEVGLCRRDRGLRVRVHEHEVVFEGSGCGRDHLLRSSRRRVDTTEKQDRDQREALHGGRLGCRE